MHGNTSNTSKVSCVDKGVTCGTRNKGHDTAQWAVTMPPQPQPLSG